MRVRTSLGGIFYLIAWLLCWVFSSAPEQLLLPGSLFSLVFAILLVLRLRHRLPTEHDLDSLLRWRWQHWALLLLNSMFWGLATGCTLLLTPLHDSQLIAALSTIAFSTAAIFNFPMQRLPAACAVVLIYLPSVVIMLPRAAEQIGVLITLGFSCSTCCWRSGAITGSTMPVSTCSTSCWSNANSSICSAAPTA